MQKFVAYSALLSIGILLTASPVSAQTFTVNSGTTSGMAQNLANNNSTSTVQSTGTLNVTSGSTVAITVSTTGTATITNSGLIEQTKTGRAIQTLGVGSTLTINNNAGATITAVGNDAFQEKVLGTVTINNYGTISTTHADETTVTKGTGDQAVNMNILNADGTTTSYSNTVNNFAGGVITSYEADGLRPGAGGFVYNSGTISSTSASDNTSSSDGIDAQVNNSGVTIVNGSSTTAVNGVTSANLIEGERHGITGGTQTDTAYTASSPGGIANGIYDQPFTMSVTNNAGSTIQGDNGSGINIDGVDGTEVVTVVNTGTITGNGVTRDGDGIDVDGLLILTNNTGGKIVSKNAYQDTSEGVTVGGGTIINSGLIEGSTTGSSTFARGITLAGIDHTTTNGVDTDVPIQSIYANTTVTNNNGGTIKGDTESGITVLGTTSGGHTVTITNNAGGTIEGSNTGVSENTAITTGANAGQLSGGSLNKAVIELDDTSNTYVVNEAGIIKQDTTATGSAIAMHGASNTLNITGGSATVIGDITGDTTTDSTLYISPGAGNSFSYGYNASNFTTFINYNSTSASATTGTVTFSGASTNTGTTTVSGGTFNVTNGSGSATGTGKVIVNSGATLGGTGIIQPGLNTANGITVSAGATLVSGGTQSGTTAGTGLTLDNSLSGGVILNASLGTASLGFWLGANHSATTMNVLGNTEKEIQFGTADTFALTDLNNDPLTSFSVNTPYILIQAGSTVGLPANDALYSGLTTTGGLDGNGNPLDGYVTSPVSITLNGVNETGPLQLYLTNGELEVVPEPGTWAMILSGVGVLLFVQTLRRKSRV